MMSNGFYLERVKRAVLTEKSVRLVTSANKYTFDVDVKLTKPQIKKIIKDIYKVDVLAVNTHRPPRKKKRLGMYQGFKQVNKRVIITIKADQQIDLFLDQTSVSSENDDAELS